MNHKFKIGDLVEVHGLINATEYNGDRFVIQGIRHGSFQSVTGEIQGDVTGYEAPIPSGCCGDKIYYAGKNLRKVNPDGDELSSYSFEELISSLKNTENA